MLPVLAKSIVDKLITEAQDGLSQLENKPENTVDYVNKLSFLDEIQLRVNIISQSSECSI